LGLASINFCQNGTSSLAFSMASLHSVYVACCSVLQCVAVRCSLSGVRRPWIFAWRLCILYTQRVAVCCSALQCVACGAAVYQGHVVLCVLHGVSAFRIRSVLQCAAVCCSASQCGAVCFSVFQCVAVCCSAVQCVKSTSSVGFPMASLHLYMQRIAVHCSALQFVILCCNLSGARRPLLFP